MDDIENADIVDSVARPVQYEGRSDRINNDDLADVVNVRFSQELRRMRMGRKHKKVQPLEDKSPLFHLLQGAC